MTFWQPTQKLKNMFGDSDSMGMGLSFWAIHEKIEREREKITICKILCCWRAATHFRHCGLPSSLKVQVSPTCSPQFWHFAHSQCHTLWLNHVKIMLIIKMLPKVRSGLIQLNWLMTSLALDELNILFSKFSKKAMNSKIFLQYFMFDVFKSFV